MKNFKRHAMYFTVALLCAVMNGLFPTYIPQLILYLLLIWRIEDKAGL